MVCAKKNVCVLHDNAGLIQPLVLLLNSCAEFHTSVISLLRHSPEANLVLVYIPVFTDDDSRSTG